LHAIFHLLRIDAPLGTLHLRVFLGENKQRALYLFIGQFIDRTGCHRTIHPIAQKARSVADKRENSSVSAVRLAHAAHDPRLRNLSRLSARRAL